MSCDFRPRTATWLGIFRPTLERMAGRAGLGIAGQVGHLGRAQAGVGEILTSELDAPVVEDPPGSSPHSPRASSTAFWRSYLGGCRGTRVPSNDEKPRLDGASRV